MTKIQIVLKYYPNAVSVNVGCKSGDYYHIKDGIFKLGMGKSKNEAWAAAYRSIND